MEIVIFSILIISIVFAYKKNSWLIWPIGVVLIYFVGFRNISVGTDTANYALYFQILKNGGIIDSEYLYGILNKIVIYLNGEFFWVQILASILTIVPILWTVSSKSKFPYLSLFLYLTLYIYFYSFNIVRQCIAISICFAAVSLFLDKKMKFFGLVLLAINFHASAIIIVPLYFIRNIKLNSVKISILLISTFFMGIFLPSYLVSLGATVGYAKYLTGNFELGSLVGNMFFSLLLNGIFFIVYKFENQKNDRLFYLFLLFLIVSNILIRFPFGNRIILYFGIFQILYFPNLLARLPRKERSIMFIFILLYALLMFAIFYGNGEILPYKTVFE
ncbi:MAG: EpsG family protein [Sphingobacterium sp.]|nr:EpsG family protein [Sphingobacterium sp.]